MLSAVLGLIGALIGAGAVLGAVWLQDRRTSRAAAVDARERAYVDLLIASVAVARRLHALITTAKARSGLQEGFAVVLGQRQPLEPMALHDWVEADFRPLLDAWSRVWATGTPRGVHAANKLVACCTDLVAILNPESLETPKDKLRQTVLGIDTREMLIRFEEAVKPLAEARRDLAEIVRNESGRPPTELFGAGY